MNSKDTKIAIFSDLHLGVHMNRSMWHNIALDWAKWFTSELKQKKINKVFFCGDFFHSRSEITVDTLHIASDLLDMFEGIELHMIAGNHDSYYKHNSSVNSISILKGRSNVIIYDKPQLIQMNGKELMFCPWGTTLEHMNACDAIFGHFEIESFKMNAYKVCEDGFKSGDLNKFAPLVISGHFHLREERKYENGTILYVGSPFELDFGDAQSTKGYYTLDLNDLSYEFFPNNLSPKHQKINLSNLIQIDDFNNKAPALLANNIVKLVVDKKIESRDLEKLSLKLNSYHPLNIELDQTYNFSLFTANQSDEVDLSGIDMTSAITEFVNMLDIQNRKDVTEYALSLYNNCK